ncbi:MAG: ABC transporter permease [Bacteroides sp.]
MIQQLFKLIWNQRRQNSWILIELLVVLVALWSIADLFVVQTALYLRPLGYQVENCWRLSFDTYPQASADYEADTLRQKTQGEALAVLLDRLRRKDEVDEACVAFYSSPYSSGNTWRQLLPCNADSVRFKEQSYHCYYVSPEYFKVFDIHDQKGAALDDLARKHPTDLFVTPDLATDFFGTTTVTGRKVLFNSGDNVVRIAAVTTPIREDDFSRSTPMFYSIMQASELEEITNQQTANRMEVTLRMHNALTQDEMNAFLLSLGNQLREGNLYVNGATNWAEKRDELLSHTWQTLHIRLLLALFILLNVFFGITGTFWLRIEQRRSETGLRMALGSTRRNVGLFFTTEGWLLLATIVPLVLVIIANFFVMEIPETYHVPFTWWRFALGFGVSLFLMALMIALGTWLPARRTMKMQPAEALHYE